MKITSITRSTSGIQDDKAPSQRYHVFVELNGEGYPRQKIIERVKQIIRAEAIAVPASTVYASFIVYADSVPLTAHWSRNQEDVVFHFGNT